MDAKQHPVFRELTRVKQYFEKIKLLETEPEERTMALDKAAAGRFIKHGLVSIELFHYFAIATYVLTESTQSGNDKYDLERAEKQAKERARAQLRAAMLDRKSVEASKAQTMKESDDEDSEGGVAVAPAAPQIDPNHAGKAEKKDIKDKSKGDRTSDNGKPKKERKAASKAARQEEKKERRKKKEESRKARKIQ